MISHIYILILKVDLLTVYLGQRQAGIELIAVQTRPGPTQPSAGLSCASGILSIASNPFIPSAHCLGIQLEYVPSKHLKLIIMIKESRPFWFQLFWRRDFRLDKPSLPPLHIVPKNFLVKNFYWYIHSIYDRTWTIKTVWRYCV